MTDACTATQHGTRSAYVAGCRCPDARKANREYAHYRHRRTAAAAFGAAAPFSVPATDAVTILDQLRGIGWSLRRIEAETGIKRDHLARIYGKTSRPLRRVRWATYQELRGLLDRDPVIGGGTLVDAYATWQRIRGLIALGYPKTWIAQQLGSGKALQLNAYRVTHHNAAKVLALVDTFGGTPGHSSRARQYAAARGWTADLIWQADDDSDGDDLRVSDVDEIAVDRFLSGDRGVRLTRDERQTAFDRLIRAGESRSAAAARLGINGLYAHVYAEGASACRVVRGPENVGGLQPNDHVDRIEAAS